MLLVLPGGRDEIEICKFEIIGCCVVVVVVVPTHSLDPCVCVWGGGSDHPVFGPPVSKSRHLAISSITPAGSVHKSRGDSVVRMWVQLKRWCVVCVDVAEEA